jgi:rubrerythrin
MELEEKSEGFYKAAAKVATGDATSLFEELAGDVKKRMRRVEKSKRENITEMILEPITDFDSDDYSPDVEVPAGASVKELVKKAVAFEQVAVDFYTTASEKIATKEVARTLGKLAKENARRKERLQKL